MLPGAGLLMALAAAVAAADVGHTDGILLTRLTPRDDRALVVTSPAFLNDADIPLANTQYRGNTFPGLSWTAGPVGTRSYVVVMQGEALTGPSTSIHLTLYNVAAEVTRLDAGMTVLPAGAAFGPNVHGFDQPYAGPHSHTPARQRYHLEVFALDTRLVVEPEKRIEMLEAGMRGHVLASGELVGWAARDPQAGGDSGGGGMAVGISGAVDKGQHPEMVPSLAATIAAMPKNLPRAKGPSLAAAIDAAKAAQRSCAARGVKVSVLVADSVGAPVVLLSGDGAGVRSQLITRSKAATVVEFGAASGDVAFRAQTDPGLQARAEANPDIGVLRGGGFPVLQGGERIAIVAVSGASLGGAPQLDDQCALQAVRRLERAARGQLVQH